jgi:protein gp37
VSDRSRIEWTDATWNIATGCTRVSAACDHCFIERTPPLRMAGRRFDRPGIGATTGVLLHPERLEQPLHWRKPRRIFVCSLADLFHKDVPDDLIARLWAVMAATPQHTYQILTKRPARMRALLSSIDFDLAVADAWSALGTSAGSLDGGDHTPPYPLPNVWIGVTVEDQDMADQRIPVLLDTPAAVRWISAEPLLGPIDLSRGDGCARNWLPDLDPGGEESSYTDPTVVCCGCGMPYPCNQGCAHLDWVVLGGESGPGSRPMHPDWARNLRDQCADTDVPFYFKAWGNWCPPAELPDESFRDWEAADGTSRDHDRSLRFRSPKVTGRLLDGVLCDQYPTTYAPPLMAGKETTT